MILDIVQLGDPVLRRKAHKISQIDRDIRFLAQDMVETLHDSGNGVGLAAPQVGESVRLIVVEYPEDDSVEDSPLKTYIVINPEIIWRSEEKVTDYEGCLSIPGYVGKVERNLAIKVKGLNTYGRPIRISAEGFLARIFQHEIDHLDGVCYVDRATEIHEQGEEPEDENKTEDKATSTESPETQIPEAAAGENDQETREE